MLFSSYDGVIHPVILLLLLSSEWVAQQSKHFQVHSLTLHDVHIIVVSRKLLLELLDLEGLTQRNGIVVIVAAAAAAETEHTDVRALMTLISPHKRCQVAVVAIGEEVVLKA